MKYILGVVGVLGLLLVAFIFIFTRGGNDSQPKGAQPKQLVEYAKQNSSVSVTTTGPLVGDEDRRSIQITISALERELEVLSGYDGQVIDSYSFPNTPEAYKTFLSAMSGQGFTAAKSSNIEDKWRVCPTGRHFEYKLTEMNKTVSDLWGVSCDKSGTFNGKGNTVRQLFERQIPEYTELVKDIRL